MEQNAMDEYWIDEGGLDGELRCALEGFCGSGSIGVEFEEAYTEVCGAEQICSRKRTRDESGPGPKSKACREKMRRDKLNERFVELSNVLDPTRAPKSDKAVLLSDAARVVVHLRNEAQELKDSNEKLQEAIKELKAEKNEIRDEKMRLKAYSSKIQRGMLYCALRHTFRIILTKFSAFLFRLMYVTNILTEGNMRGPCKKTT
ncbi:basic helix-loop-helix (bHLH) DNA-binding superfamily protein [Rhynchospora pubera]|uniref:Basic helix-loop-helix (BHLH) DNA-binding superfamily protein n=1 Tax=Rhynchospora pubera TaxID=906938 RepID=A0AAV8FFN1_9POAL|nr:basic helix-loop-helix (bHLH) DNA-binding superfamily protein [Rhynchospora pubera]